MFDSCRSQPTTFASTTTMSSSTTSAPRRGLPHYLISAKGIQKLGLQIPQSEIPTLRYKIFDREGVCYDYERGTDPEISYLEAAQRGFARHYIHTDEDDVDIEDGLHPLFEKVCSEIVAENIARGKLRPMMSMAAFARKYEQDLVDAVRDFPSFDSYSCSCRQSLWTALPAG